MDKVNVLIVFLEGVLSIFSPCILPILPVYLSMLANSSVEDIKKEASKKGILIKNTIFFTAGISSTFFILGSTTRAFSAFFRSNRTLLMILGSIFILIMGLFYLGVLKVDLLNREKKLQVTYKSMSPVSAFLLGFTFSFGWTPCIGPILASVLVMASSSDSVLVSNLLILVYTIGFILPFLLTSIFYSKLYHKLNSTKKHMNEIKKISGAFIIIAGLIMLITGITDYKNELKFTNRIETQATQNDANKKSEEEMNAPSQEAKEPDNTEQVPETVEPEPIVPINFTLVDQYGNTHTLSDYKGKTIFLNIWATWCPPCREEMPYIEELYKEYNQNQEDVIILGIASPKLGREGSKDHIIEFLEKNQHTFPVVFDEEGLNIFGYGINSFPSTLIINKEGYLTTYIPGGMDKETMKSFIESER